MTSAGAEYADKDRHLALQFASAAREAGVGRIIYLGGLGETGPDLSEHLSSRREVEEALASTGVPVTVLARRDDHRFGFGILRDLALSCRAIARDDHSEMGEHPVPADCCQKCRRVSGGSAVPARDRWKRIRYRRPGGALLPGHHEHHGAENWA